MTVRRGLNRDVVAICDATRLHRSLECRSDVLLHRDVVAMYGNAIRFPRS